MAEIRTPDVDDLLSVLAALDDPDAIFALLEDLFTVREIRETSQRLGVARLLAAGKSYAAIEAETGASATTIARVSKCLSYGAGGRAAVGRATVDAFKKEKRRLGGAASLQGFENGSGNLVLGKRAC